MTSTDVFYRTASDHAACGDVKAAAAAGMAGLRIDPDHPGLNEVVGLAEYDLENFGPAVHYLETASLHGPLGPAAQLALADCYHRFGQVWSAAAIYDFLAEPGRCPTPLLPAVAKGLGFLGDYSAALGICLRLTALRPNFHPAWYGVAFYRMRLGRSAADAIPALRAAHELAPHAVPYRVLLAGLLAEGGRPQEAHTLVAEVPVEAFGCRCLCRTLAAAAAAAGDDARAAAFLARAEDLTESAETDEFNILP